VIALASRDEGDENHAALQNNLARLRSESGSIPNSNPPRPRPTAAPRNLLLAQREESGVTS